MDEYLFLTVLVLLGEVITLAILFLFSAPISKKLKEMAERKVTIEEERR